MLPMLCHFVVTVSIIALKLILKSVFRALNPAAQLRTDDPGNYESKRKDNGRANNEVRNHRSAP
jgi:hypothetical protein